MTCRTVLPDAGIDLVLGIMDALTHKATIAKDTVGVPTPLFPDSPQGSYTSLLETICHPERAHAQADDPQRDHGWFHA